MKSNDFLSEHIIAPLIRPAERLDVIVGNGRNDLMTCAQYQPTHSKPAVKMYGDTIVLLHPLPNTASISLCMIVLLNNCNESCCACVLSFHLVKFNNF